MDTIKPTVFTATAEQYAEFERLLAAPLPSSAKFDRLFTQPSIFEKPFEVGGVIASVHTVRCDGASPDDHRHAVGCPQAGGADTTVTATRKTARRAGWRRFDGHDYSRECWALVVAASFGCLD